MKKILTILIVLLFSLTCLTSNGYCKKKPPCNIDNINIELSDCYKTRQINSYAFIDKTDKIKNVSTRCRKGFFMTGLTQSAEKDPINFGQYVITSEIECCRPCLTEKKKK